MRTLDILQTAATNLTRNKTRSILTIIAVFVGATTITLTNGVGDGIKGYLNRQVSGLGADNVLIISQKSDSAGSTNGGTQQSDGPQTYDPSKIKAQSTGQQGPGGGFGSQFLLTDSDIDKIRAGSDITAVRPLQNVTADYITTGSQKYVIDIQPSRTDSIRYDLAAGRPISDASTSAEALLPSSYLKALGFADASTAVGKTVTVAVSDQTGHQKSFAATVAGVATKSFVTSNSLITNDAFTGKLLAFQNTGKPRQQTQQYASAFAEFRSGLTETQVSALKDRLAGQGISALTIKDQQKTIFSVIDAVITVLNLFGIVALAAASFGIINTLYMAVQERTKEIGLMKAMGMSRRKIFALFSIEAALLGLVGSLLGVLAANGLGRLINHVASAGFLKDFEGLHLLSFTAQSVTVIMLLITGIAFLAGTLPARRASKLNAIEALRYE